MGIFNSTKDFFKGFSNSLKKEYSPFLSAALIHFPDFEIKELKDLCQGATVSKKKADYEMYLTLLRRPKKVNELFSTVFQYSKDSVIRECETYKPLGEFLSYEDFKKSRNISRQAFDNISKVMGSGWLGDQYLNHKVQRSYVRYINSPEKKSEIEKARRMVLSSRIALPIPEKDKYFLKHISLDDQIRNMILSRDKSSLSVIKSQLSEDYLVDTEYKKIDLYDRLYARWLGSGGSQFFDSSKFEAFHEYRILDNWVLKFAVVRKNDIIYEDFALINGVDLTGNKLYEDDYLFISHGIEDIMSRWI